MATCCKGEEIRLLYAGRGVIFLVDVMGCSRNAGGRYFRNDRSSVRGRVIGEGEMGRAAGGT